jgi:methyltransferase (TIGR00027 family)
VLVCQGRAAAHGRIAPQRFTDPTALVLLHEDELVPVQWVRAGAPPKGWPERVEFEMVRAAAEVVVPRTIAMDDAIRDRPPAQLVILGAGLDGRAWRMPELAGADVFEVDHPASQQDKRDRGRELPARAGTPHYVPVDFAYDRLDDALDSAGHQGAVATTWVWEGVIPYLTRAQVAGTMAIVGGRSAPGSRLIVNYQSPAVSAAAGRLLAQAMTALARRPSPWASEPRCSSWTPAAMRNLLAGHGFAVSRDDDLLSLAGQLEMTVRHRRSLRTGRVAVAER